MTRRTITSRGTHHSGALRRHICAHSAHTSVHGCHTHNRPVHKLPVPNQATGAPSARHTSLPGVLGFGLPSILCRTRFPSPSNCVCKGCLPRLRSSHDRATTLRRCPVSGRNPTISTGAATPDPALLPAKRATLGHLVRIRCAPAVPTQNRLSVLAVQIESVPARIRPYQGQSQRAALAGSFPARGPPRSGAHQHTSAPTRERLRPRRLGVPVALIQNALPRWRPRFGAF